MFSKIMRPGSLHSLSVGGMERTYWVHLPKATERTGPLPLVLALHGATMNGPFMAWFSNLNRKADQAGFIVVYPDGTGQRSSFTWNGGNCCGSAASNQVDDVAFIDALLNELNRTYPVDRRRVFATGMSNGGIMAYRLAAELSPRIAAICPVSAAVGTNNVTPQRAVSVLHFHGTRDEFIPFAGGRGARSISGTDFCSVSQSIGTWVTVNGCHEQPLIEKLTPGDGELPVVRHTYAAGRDGTEVVLIEIDGGGHTWPGRKAPSRLLGPSTLQVSANDLMWDFFQKHGRKT